MSIGRKTLDDLLAPISQRLGRTVPDTVPAPPRQVVPARATDGLSQKELVDMFSAEAEKVRVGVTRCTRASLASCIADIVAQDLGEEACCAQGGSSVETGLGNVQGVVCANDERFGACGLFDALGKVAAAAPVTVWDPARAQASVEAARQARWGVTYATAGIAETGTVVQVSDWSCGRSASLLPLAHLAVVDADTIVPTMAEVLASFEDAQTGQLEAAGNSALDRLPVQGRPLPSQLCFISGPSATADIELVRVEGVHGPMFVHYVVVEGRL